MSTKGIGDSNPSFQAFVGLGSNLDNPIQQLQTAIRALAQSPDLQMIGLSSFYRTPPVGYTDQPDFVNAVIRLRTPLTPLQLLRQLQAQENAQNRTRDRVNGPRTLDLDLLLYDQQTWNTPHLILPHPRMYERLFVLIPLFEVMPAHRTPDGQSLRELLQSFKSEDIQNIQRIVHDLPPLT